MSWSEEFGVEAEAEAEELRLRIRDAAESGIWTMRDGTKIRVSEMTEDHIHNTIRMLERNDTSDFYFPWIERFRRELEGRRSAVTAKAIRRADEMTVSEAMDILNAFPVDMRKPGAFNFIAALTVIEGALKNAVSKDSVLALRQEIGAYGMDISSTDVEKLPALFPDERAAVRKKNEEPER